LFFFRFFSVFSIAQHFKNYIFWSLYSLNVVYNQLKQTRKIHFFDNGIRNMINGNFKPLELRADKGALWENFLVSERLKQNIYKETFSKMFFGELINRK